MLFIDMPLNKSTIENEFYNKNEQQYLQKAQASITSGPSLPQSLQALIPLELSMDESTDVNEVCEILRNNPYSDYEEFDCRLKTKRKEVKREHLFEATTACRYNQNMEYMNPSSLVPYSLGELAMTRYDYFVDGEYGVRDDFQEKIGELKNASLSYIEQLCVGGENPRRIEEKELKFKMDSEMSLLIQFVKALEPSKIDFGTNDIQHIPYGYFDQPWYSDTDLLPSPTVTQENRVTLDYDSEDSFEDIKDLCNFGEESNSSCESVISEAPSSNKCPPPRELEIEDENEDNEQDDDEEDAHTTDEDENPKIKEEPLSPENLKRKRKTVNLKKPAKRRRRTRKNLLKPGSQLYQFILQLLDDKDKEQFIRWVRQSDGVFRIVKKEEVAKLWGEFKNRRMSYDSLSRGLRHYYQQGLLNSVSKKLHYQFTKKALDYWNEIRDKDSIEEL